LIPAALVVTKSQSPAAVNGVTITIAGSASDGEQPTAHTDASVALSEAPGSLRLNKSAVAPITRGMNTSRPIVLPRLTTAGSEYVSFAVMSRTTAAPNAATRLARRKWSPLAAYLTEYGTRNIDTGTVSWNKSRDTDTCEIADAVPSSGSNDDRMSPNG
jgi:hypothetical protein